jgi:hypothetical protein
MSDFETHPHGTSEELRLSRMLAQELEKAIYQNNETLPFNVTQAYNKLYEHYVQLIKQETE